VAEPSATPVITPVDALTVAIAELPDVQVPPEFPFEVNNVVAPIHTF
jgi:hypothetical protein